MTKMHLAARMIKALRQKALHHGGTWPHVRDVVEPSRAKAEQGQEAGFGKAGQEYGANTEISKPTVPPTGHVQDILQGWELRRTMTEIIVLGNLLLCPTREDL